MQIYTSVAANYVPKARVLAESVKRFHPEARFHLVLSDRLDDKLARSPAPFDRILHVENLPIENVRRWIFEHNLVELCTAVKGAAAQVILEEHPGEPLFYVDPDVVVLGALDPLLEELGRHDVLLTPHQLDPEQDRLAIMDNEICSLQHGVFNLGFLGLAPTAEGRRFLDWWSERLRVFCRAEIDQGLFTDQRWADLAPAFFPTLGIIRHPGCNVATWNLTGRTVAGSLAEGFTVNGQPLVFYHFSGFDSGAQKTMLDKFGRNNPALYELRQWYLEECRRLGQDELGASTWAYATFDNGRPITDHHRRLYRGRADLQKAFPDPWATREPARSYYHWYRREVGKAVPQSRADLEQELLRCRSEVMVLNQTIGNLDATNKQLVAANESLSGTVKTFNAQVHALNATNNAYSHTNAALNAANEALIHSNISHVQTNAALNDANRRLGDELSAARAEIDEARKLLDGARYQLDMTRDQLEIARNELSLVYQSKGYRAVRTVSHLVRGRWPRSA